MTRIISFRPEEKFENLPHGIDIKNIPLTRIREIENIPEPDWNGVSGIAFLSTTSVNFFLKRFGKHPLKNLKVFSIGNKTRDLLNENNIDSNTPEIHNSDGLASLICNSLDEDTSVLIPRNRIHTDVLTDRLSECGIKGINIYLYAYEEIDASHDISMESKTPDFIGFVFTSPEEVRIFKRITGNQYNNMKFFPIGSETEKELRKNGFHNIPFVGKGDFDDLIKRIMENSGEWI